MMNIETRLIELESKLAFQEDTIEILNSVVIDQQNQIDRLHQALSKLNAVVISIQENPTSDPSQEPPPPHY